MSDTHQLLDSDLSNQNLSSETYIADGIEGHPKQLALLFFTEMWERFSFYAGFIGFVYGASVKICGCQG